MEYDERGSSSGLWPFLLAGIELYDPMACLGLCITFDGLSGLSQERFHVLG